jgi:hypothetical protein
MFGDDPNVAAEDSSKIAIIRKCKGMREKIMMLRYRFRQWAAAENDTLNRPAPHLLIRVLKTAWRRL